MQKYVEIFGEQDTRQIFPTLNSGEIHIWSASFSGSPLFVTLCRQCLSDVEIQRLSFYEFEEAKNNYLMSQGGLKILLSLYLHLPSDQVKIGRHTKGKPFSLDDKQLYFNISNSGDQVVFAFSKSGEVGIDIEEIRPLIELDELIEKNFSQKEREYIDASLSDRLERFFKFWTVKESYLKAIGEGMRLTPDNLEFTIEKNDFKLQGVKGFFEHQDRISKSFDAGQKYHGTLTYLGEATKVEKTFILK